MDCGILERIRTEFGHAPERELVAVASRIGVPAGTFIKIARGKTVNPRYATVLRLQRVHEPAYSGNG